MKQTTLIITGMTCAACAARIEKVLNRLPGVEASVNFASEHARVALSSAETTPQQVVAAVEKEARRRRQENEAGRVVSDGTA